MNGLSTDGRRIQDVRLTPPFERRITLAVTKTLGTYVSGVAKFLRRWRDFDTQRLRWIGRSAGDVSVGIERSYDLCDAKLFLANKPRPEIRRDKENQRTEHCETNSDARN